MTAKREVDISALIAQGDAVREAVRRGGLEAMKIHIRAGEPMVSWKDGKVVFIPPAELEKMLAEEAEQDAIMQSGGGILTSTIANEDQSSSQERPMAKSGEYKPPCRITPAITHLISEISEAIGRITALSAAPLAPQLRRENRIKTIHASLAIEQNTLTLEQVTAVIEGKRVLGNPREIQEVRNALATYDAMGEWEPTSVKNLLAAHGLLMAGLTDEAGRFRSGGVGVFAAGRIVHMAPPAKMVPELVHNLLEWVRGTDEHPLIASSLLHYELEFIHPFADGNGRMGRLWQTLALMKWKPILAWLPVETVIKHNQADYYRILGECDKAADATCFVEFILQSLHSAVGDISQTDQVGDHVTDQVKTFLEILGTGEMSGAEAMRRLSLSHRPTFRQNYLTPALEHGLIERTDPDSPRSPRQRYRLTAKGDVLRKSLVQKQK